MPGINILTKEALAGSTIEEVLCSAVVAKAGHLSAQHLHRQGEMTWNTVKAFATNAATTENEIRDRIDDVVEFMKTKTQYDLPKDHIMAVPSSVAMLLTAEMAMNAEAERPSEDKGDAPRCQ